MRTAVLPTLDPKGAIHTTAGDRFPVQRHKPIRSVFDKLILLTERGHADTGPS
jgi:hypothetical protein